MIKIRPFNLNLNIGKKRVITNMHRISVPVVGDMIFPYAFKRVVRSWRLFAALLLGVVLASTFFAGINVGADTTAKQAIDQQLSQLPVDIVVEFMSGESPTSPMEKYGLSSDNATKVAHLISGIEGIVSSEVISRANWRPQVHDGADVRRWFSDVVGITDDSCVYDGLTVKSGSSSLGVNETYVWADSRNAGAWKLGDVISVNIPVQLEDGSMMPPQKNWIPLNLTVVGFVDLDKKASLIALGEIWGNYPILFPEGEDVYKENLLITDWDKTFANLIDAVFDLAPKYNPIQMQILAFLDRESLISPWDIATSISKVSTITSQINNKILSYGVLHAYSYLESHLYGYQLQSQIMPLRFILPALPVFFIAWYLGTTVSDVSLNLRRREIGLLLTKGFSRRQLLRMLLTEATLIGLIGGLIGVGLSRLLSPFFVKAGGGEWFSGPLVVGIETVILTVIFSVIITFLSMFLSARRASRLETVEALREYRYVEEIKPFKQRWPRIAFILGTYKIIMWLLGINLYTLAPAPTGSTNIIVQFLWGVWVLFDGLLGYIGPILFFWGLTKLLIRGSLKFQEVTVKVARFLGDLGSLATKIAQRNSARVASIAFLIALIIGYSVQVTGAYGSERDYTMRQIKFDVGADISVTLTTLINASQTMNQIEGLSDVSSTVLEYSFRSEAGGVYELLEVKAVDPVQWLTTAFCEGEWFTGNDVATAFQQMATDNDTVILDQGITSWLNLDLNDAITLTFGEAETCSLRIVGFFGAKSPEGPYSTGFSILYPSAEIPFYMVPLYAYVPEGLYHLVEENVYATGKILVKLAPGADGKTVADQIRDFEANNIGTVYSIAEELQEWQSDVRLSGPLNVQLLSVAFAVVAASIGTGLVTVVSLKERRKEVSILRIRGLSFKQIAQMFLTENLSIVTFAVLLGSVVGLIIVYGSVAATNIVPSPHYILLHHVVFPMDMILTLFVCFVLVFASTIIPIIVMLRRYVSSLERIVRE